MLKQRGFKLGVIVYGESSGDRGMSIQSMVMELDSIATGILMLEKRLHRSKGCISERATETFGCVA